MKKTVYIILFSFLIFTFSPGSAWAIEKKNISKDKKPTQVPERRKRPSLNTPVLSGKKSGNTALYALAIVGAGAAAGAALALGGGGGGGNGGGSTTSTTGIISVTVNW